MSETDEVKSRIEKNLRVVKMYKAIRDLCRENGFEVWELITLRDMETGEIYEYM